MEVFKAYFKIIRKQIPMISVYVVLFIGISMIFTSILGSLHGEFAATKSKVALFNDDKGSPIAVGLEAYLGDMAAIVKIPDNTESIEDALFCGNIEYALRIPAGFSKGLMEGTGSVKLMRTAASGTSASVYTDMLVNRYLGIAELYARSIPGISQAQIAEYVAADLAVQTDVKLNTYGRAAETNTLTYYFNYLAYSIMAVMMIGVTSFMMAFNEKDFSNRNQCSPMKPLWMNVQILLGNMAFAAIVWTAFCTAIFLLYGKAPLNAGTALLCVNALSMTVVSLGMGFLAGKFIRNAGVQSAVTNVVSLGMSFICGVFVPQEMLGKTVLDIARFLPAYWYVKAVDDIKNMTAFSFQDMLPALYGMLIQLGFAAALFIVALVVTKQRRMSAA